VLDVKAQSQDVLGSISENGVDGHDVILKLDDVSRTFQLGGEVIHALDGVSMVVQRGEFLSVMGRSGSGKSTLLNVVGCLDRPTFGTIVLDGVDVTRVPKGQLPRIRREKIGFVFQSFNLIPTLTALENVMLPMQYAGLREREQRALALAALDAVGLADRLGHRPSQLSGGQAQRVAIARALAPRPAIILADEPTGALDTHIARAVIQLMRQFNRDRHQTFILVTHDPLVAEQTNRIVRLSDGRVETDTRTA
jgi:putative ABC transport system ATP-binding protein